MRRASLFIRYHQHGPIDALLQSARRGVTGRGNHMIKFEATTVLALWGAIVSTVLAASRRWLTPLRLKLG